MIKIALVFSGGGARGAFQLGVWRALNELGISPMVKAVYGTSVGAINGAAYVQDDYELSNEIWQRISYSTVFKQAVQEGSKNYFDLIKTTIAQGGADVSPLKKLLRDNLDEKIIRKQDLDFGMVVFNLTHIRPMYRTKSEIPEGKLIEYVIASSTFPIFQPHSIDKELYIDGGVYDNRPFDFINDKLDINHVICVDVTIFRHIWRNKKPAQSNAKVTYIRPTKLLGSPMAFDNDRINKNIQLGYENAMHQLERSSLLQSTL